MNLVDKFIDFFSPKAGAERAKYRALAKTIRSYEGATKGRRGDGWNAASYGSVNNEIMGSLSTLRDRSRDLIRNNPYAEAAVTEIVGSVIGTGIVPTALHQNPEVARAINREWKRWGETTLCDVEGRLDFYGLQALVARGIFEAGDIILRRVFVEDKKSPTRLQLLEPDLIDTSKNEELKDGKRIIQGIEVDKFGRILAIWLYDRHPSDPFWTSNASIRVAEADLCFPFKKVRAAQLRGVPWLAPVMLRLKDFDEYEDAQLVRQKIAACFTAFIHDIEMPEAESNKEEDAVSEKVGPGLIENLPNGKTVTLASPPGVQGYAEYSSCTLHGVATGLGITYENLTKDYSQVNYSSARMGYIAQYRAVKQYQWHMIVPQVCARVWLWFLDDLVMTGRLERKERDLVSSRWTTPKREMIDPGKEIQAQKEAIRNGVQTLSGAILENGDDPEEMLEQRAKDDATLDRLKIKVDCDPRAESQSVQNVPQNKTNEETNA